MKLFRLILILVVLAATAGRAAAFDGARKGFVLGLGAGYSPAASSSQSHHEREFEETARGVAGSFGLGYSWDARNVLLLDANIALFESDLFDGRATQGYTGFTWYHYHGPVGGAFFTALGLGSYAMSLEDGRKQPGVDAPDDGGDPFYQAASPRRRGPGALLGFGYEFEKHWQVGAYVATGRTTAYEVDIDHFQFSVLVQLMAF